MPTPIVPLNSPPQSRHFERKNRNATLLKIRPEKVELTFFHSINHEVLETILDKVLAYDHPTQ
ncbi:MULTISPECIES: hypothetical protein [Streptococcus]|uniref:hypothetical protein n=1 Tax=Streptococcus TaxID=1301 RepID=UPI0012DD2EE0|nr:MULTISPECIES: hypothetical protein [Streptococcus]QHF54881.1 hypothetical protein BZG42_05805 [Streptococcus sp. DAT741]